MPTHLFPATDDVQISPLLNLASGKKWVYDHTATNEAVTISCVQPVSGYDDWLQLKAIPDYIKESPNHSLSFPFHNRRR